MSKCSPNVCNRTLILWFCAPRRSNYTLWCSSLNNPAFRMCSELDALINLHQMIVNPSSHFFTELKQLKYVSSNIGCKRPSGSKPRLGNDGSCVLQVGRRSTRSFRGSSHCFALTKSCWMSVKSLPYFSSASSNRLASEALHSSISSLQRTGPP